MKVNIYAIFTDKERMREQLYRFQSFLETSNLAITIEESQSPEVGSASPSGANTPTLSVPLPQTPAENGSATGPAGQGQQGKQWKRRTGAPRRLAHAGRPTGDQRAGNRRTQETAPSGRAPTTKFSV